MVSLRLIRSPAPLAAQDAVSGCFETFDRELDYLFRTLQRLGARPVDMEDLLQDVFIALHQNWPMLDTTRSLRPWLFGVAFRMVRTHRRRRGREALHAELESEDGAPDPETRVQHHEAQALLSAGLEQVPEARRSVLIKHEIEGLEVTDIARQLSLTKFGVYARLYRGRKELGRAVRRLHKMGGTGNTWNAGGSGGGGSGGKHGQGKGSRR